VEVVGIWKDGTLVEVKNNTSCVIQASYSFDIVVRRVLQ